MGLAALIARRSLGGSPGRTLFSVLGVAVGIATVVAVFTVDHVTVLSRTRYLDPGWGADLEVRPGAGVEDPRRELLELEGVAGVAAFFQNDVRFRPLAGGTRGARGGGVDAFESVRLVALEARGARSLGVYFVEQGGALDSVPGGALIGRALADDYGLSVGDRVLLAAPERAARKECVEGELRVVGESSGEAPQEVFTVAGVLAREGLGRRSNGRVVVIDYAAGQRLFEDVYVESMFWIRRDAAADLEALESGLAREFSFQRNERTAVGQAADEKAFRNGVFMAGLFALLLGLYVIFHTLSMSLMERVREVGTLHALGTSRMQIARVFFTEAVLIAVAAGVLGTAGGLVLARAMLWKGITTLGVTGRPVGPFVVPWRQTLLLSGLGVLIALLGSIYPMVKARGTDVVSALRGDELRRKHAVTHRFQLLGAALIAVVVPALFFAVVPLVGASDTALVATILVGIAVLATVMSLPVLLPALVGRACAAIARPFGRRWPLAGLLAARSLAQSPTRIGASVAAIALVTAAFVGLKGMTSSLRGEIEVWSETAVLDKVFLRNLPEDARLADVIAAAEGVPEALGVEPATSRAYVSFLLIGLRPDQLARYGPIAADPELGRRLATGQGLILSERLARQRGLSVGDRVYVSTSGHGVQEFAVLAVSDAYGYFFRPDERAYAVTADRHLARYFCLDVDVATEAAVRLDGGAGPGALAALEASLRERFPEAERLQLEPGTDVLRLHLEDIDRDFVLFDIILLLTAALAGLGVLNGQLLAALERRKELGVLRALGMTRGQVAGAVLLESGVLGLTGGLLGLVVGSALTPVIVAFLRILSGLALPSRTAGAWLPLCLVGALALALVAGLYPIWRMNRMDAVRAVRTG